MQSQQETIRLQLITNTNQIPTHKQSVRPNCQVVFHTTNKTITKAFPLAVDALKQRMNSSLDCHAGVNDQSLNGHTIFLNLLKRLFDRRIIARVFG